jgi:hypothetical protein
MTGYSEVAGTSPDQYRQTRPSQTGPSSGSPGALVSDFVYAKRIAATPRSKPSNSSPLQSSRLGRKTMPRPNWPFSLGQITPIQVGTTPTDRFLHVVYVRTAGRGLLLLVQPTLLLLPKICPSIRTVSFSRQIGNRMAPSRQMPPSLQFVVYRLGKTSQQP